MRRLLAALAASIALVAPAAAARPLVVILADTSGTETTDLIAPYAILAESGAVDVKVVAASLAPAALMPGRAFVQPQMTLDGLAKAYPAGPDVVIVPAMHRVEDPARSEWLRTQARRGARVMSICDGALVLAASGLLDGRQATVHWFSRSGVAKKYPKVAWRHDQRWVVDGSVTTTAGVSASAPASLALLRDLAGDEVMRATAGRLGLAAPDSRHAGADYRLTARAVGVVAANTLAFWGHEQVGVPIAPGFDELGFATVLDGWSRTYRSTAWAMTASGAVTSRRGLTILSDKSSPSRFDREVAPAGPGAMEAMFNQLRSAYGEPTARFVALQLEHPYGAASAW
jgi:putative intracellular protease/amidase